MEFTHSHRFDAPPDAVWDALRSPAVLRACIDGCDAVTRQGAEFALTLRMPLGALRATPLIRALVQGAERPSRVILVFRADDARAGAARGRIEIALGALDGMATQVDVHVGASLSGPVAQLPARLLHIGVQRIAADFCDELDALLRAQSGRGPNRVRLPGTGIRVPPRARSVDLAAGASAGLNAGASAVGHSRDVGKAAGDGDRSERGLSSGIRAVTWGLAAVLAAACYWVLRTRY